MKKASRLPDYLGHILEAIHRELPSLYAQIKAVVLGWQAQLAFPTDTHTVVSSNDHTYHVYTVDSAHTQLLIDHNIVNAGRVL